MAIKLIVDALDEIPEALHAEYKQQKIKVGNEEKEIYLLDVEGVDQHPSVTNLKSAFERQKNDNKTLKSENTELKQKVETIPEDFDAEEWVKFKNGEFVDIKDPEQKRQFEEKVVQARKMLEQKIEQLKKDKDVAVADQQKEIARLKGVIEKLLVSEGLSKALDEAGVNPDLKDGAMALLSNQIKVVEEDGDFKAVVETDIGPVDVAKQVADWMSSDKGKKYVKPAVGGGAGGHTSTVINGENPFAEGSRNLTRQQELIKANPARAKSLAIAAGIKSDQLKLMGLS